jgi:hypothetical protein
MRQEQLGESAIRDTLAAVFRDPAYNRSAQETLGEKLLAWIQWLLYEIARVVGDSPVLYWSTIALLVAVVAAVLGRSIYLAFQRARLAAAAMRSGAGGDGDGFHSDAWLLAQRYAANGQYTEAAHAVYRHLLEWLAHRENIRLHPSKTVGDYARELRARSSRIFSHYREFARSYEVVIYGLGSCDRERYDRLLSLATTITQKKNG